MQREDAEDSWHGEDGAVLGTPLRRFRVSWAQPSGTLGRAYGPAKDAPGGPLQANTGDMGAAKAVHRQPLSPRTPWGDHIVN